MSYLPSLPLSPAPLSFVNWVLVIVDDAKGAAAAAASHASQCMQAHVAADAVQHFLLEFF